jgi:hypothetical protein
MVLAVCASLLARLPSARSTRAHIAAFVIAHAPLNEPPSATPHLRGHRARRHALPMEHERHDET